MVEHRGCSINLRRADAAAYAPRRRPIASLQIASLSFDVSVWELFCPLLAGGARRARRTATPRAIRPRLLRGWWPRRTSASLRSCPSLLRASPARRSPDERPPPSLRLADRAAARRCRRRSSRARLRARSRASRCINALRPDRGPDRRHAAALAAPPGADGTRCRSAARSPTRRSTSSTRGVAAGADRRARRALHRRRRRRAAATCGRPELTAERVRPRSVRGSRGSPALPHRRPRALARRTATLEFLGRLDHQVKVRGFRIELGEIEAVARARTRTSREAVVVAREDRPRRASASSPTSCPRRARGRRRGRAPRASSRGRCPTTWCPAPSCALAALPLTPNGKVDRRALPAPELPPRPPADGGARALRPRSCSPASGPTVLGVERVGVHDNFFELGGHSLLATRVISRLRAVFGVELPLRRLFEAPTVAELAAHRGGGRAATASPVAAARCAPVARDRRLPLSFAQQRLWFLDQLEPGSSAYNIPLASRLRGALDVGGPGRRRSPRSCAATRRCARPSRRGTDEPAQRIDPPAPRSTAGGRPRRARPGGRRELEARRLAAEDGAPALRPRPGAAAAR